LVLLLLLRVLPELGLDKERFLGRRRKEVERTVLQAEEAPWFLDVWAAVLYA